MAEAVVAPGLLGAVAVPSLDTSASSLSPVVDDVEVVVVVVVCVVEVILGVVVEDEVDVVLVDELEVLFVLLLLFGAATRRASRAKQLLQHFAACDGIPTKGI